ncbi:protein YgfX [uncultured Massilia sp.]|uniref:protein YgfX n=1 Tax=uncultured Massilia sp. TaxID=169973 RepID=UPI0025E4A11B|nr:protein YgfX [uncultured Massilia sp.]
MSIAVSAHVRPSRLQRLLTFAAALAQFAAALATVLAGPAAYRAAPLPAAALALAGAVLLARALRRPKTHRIDISGTGELRVTVQQGGGAPAPGAAAAAILLPGSVVWPVLMLLRCRVSAAPGGPAARARTQVVYVGRDSVDAATWRALAVALATAGRRAGGAGAVDEDWITKR